MKELKTFEPTSANTLSEQKNTPLVTKQKEDVAKMETSILSCTDEPALAKQAMHTVVVLQIQHQMSRIVRYLDLMDKLEDKLYASLESKIDSMDVYDDNTWVMLLSIQNKLQTNMIESQNLLKPYLDKNLYAAFDLAQPAEQTNETATLIPAGSREKIRESAAKVLFEIVGGKKSKSIQKVSGEKDA